MERYACAYEAGVKSTMQELLHCKAKTAASHAPNAKIRPEFYTPVGFLTLLPFMSAYLSVVLLRRIIATGAGRRNKQHKRNEGSRAVGGRRRFGLALRSGGRRRLVRGCRRLVLGRRRSGFHGNRAGRLDVAVFHGDGDLSPP